MGARCLIAIYRKKKFVIAKHCQVDGELERQGAEVLKFLCLPDNIRELLTALDVLDKSKILSFYNELSFVNDRLHCEWTYVINFDKERLEVCEGHEEKKRGHLFYNVGKPDDLVPRRPCLYKFRTLESLSEDGFIEHYKKSTGRVALRTISNLAAAFGDGCGLKGYGPKFSRIATAGNATAHRSANSSSTTRLNSKLPQRFIRGENITDRCK